MILEKTKVVYMRNIRYTSINAHVIAETHKKIYTFFPVNKHNVQNMYISLFMSWFIENYLRSHVIAFFDDTLNIVIFFVISYFCRQHTWNIWKNESIFLVFCLEFYPKSCNFHDIVCMVTNKKILPILCLFKYELQ